MGRKLVSIPGTTSYAAPEAEAVFCMLTRPKRDVFQVSDGHEAGIDTLPSDLIFDVLAVPGKGEFSAQLQENRAEPFGELERLLTQKLLDVAQRVAKEKLRSEEWLRLMAQLSDRSYEQMRVAILEFLDTDVSNISVENCISFLYPMIDSWDIDLKTFGMGVVLNRRLAAGWLKRFEFAEQEPQQPFAVEPGLEQFLKGDVLKWRCHRRGNRVSEGAEVQRKATFPNLLFYRELQNLRDPLNFPSVAQPGESD
jgi:hypothetical protein